MKAEQTKIGARGTAHHLPSVWRAPPIRERASWMRAVSACHPIVGAYPLKSGREEQRFTSHPFGEHHQFGSEDVIRARRVGCAHRAHKKTAPLPLLFAGIKKDTQDNNGSPPNSRVLKRYPRTFCVGELGTHSNPSRPRSPGNS